MIPLPGRLCVKFMRLVLEGLVSEWHCVGVRRPLKSVQGAGLSVVPRS